MAKLNVRAKEHVVVGGVHIWPDDAEGANRKMGRRIEAEVDEVALKQFGKALFKAPADKQVGESPRTK